MRTKMLTAIPLLLFTLASGGCHRVFGSRTVRVDGWKIQDNNEVYVIQRASHFPAWADSELTYADVVLETRTGGRVVHRRTLARREQTAILEEGPIRLGVLEARSNAERNRVWIVDKNSQRIIASHDRLTKITTGLGEQAPSWASPAEGVMLERVQADQKKLAATGWPPQIAGRSLNCITDDYALYANDAGSAEELKRWLETELEKFRSDESDDCTKVGVVLAIEPGEDPLLLVEKWREENVNRARRITWTSPIRNQVFSSSAGRPYCLFSGNYFRESFSMPYQEAARLGILSKHTPRPVWICFLTTDQHLIIAFDEQRERQRQQHGERLKEVPVIARIVSLPSEALFTAAALFVIPKYRSIDIELMHLQRRETLNRALIKACYEDGLLRTERLKNIRDETDRAWKDIWVRRPIE